MALPSSPIAFEEPPVKPEAVSLTVLTTRLITLRALESAPPFFELLRFFEEAFFAGAFFAGAFFAAAFFAGAFFAAFFAGAFFEAFFADTFFDAALRLAGAFFEDDAFLLAAFFDDAFFDDAFFEAAFFDADFFFDDAFLAGAFFADFFEDFLAAMDFSPIQNWSVGSRTFERKFVLRGNCVARISM
jgi:hypothetical protein